MSNLTIAVDDAIVRQARIRAIQEGTSVSAKVREFLASYAAGESVARSSTGNRSSTTVPSRPRIVLPTFRGTELLPGIDPSSNRALEEAMAGDDEFMAPSNPGRT